MIQMLQATSTRPFLVFLIGDVSSNVDRDVDAYFAELYLPMMDNDND